MITPEEACRRWSFDLCHRCGESLPEHDNHTMAYCTNRCRQAAYRARLNYRKAHPEADPRTLELAGGITER